MQKYNIRVGVPAQACTRVSLFLCVCWCVRMLLLMCDYVFVTHLRSKVTAALSASVIVVQKNAIQGQL